jgi:DNA-binding NarL/FixJ family response regulator
MRCGLRTFLELNSDWQVCGEAVDGADAVKKAHQLAPDLIVMDFSMPEMDGVEAAREIARSGTDIPILLLSLHLSPQMIESARRAGMRGAISKAEISKMRYALKALQRGETFFYPNETGFSEEGVVVADERYDELIVEVAGPQATVKLIQGAP